MAKKEMLKITLCLLFINQLWAVPRKAEPGRMFDKSRPFSNYTWVSSHNAWNTGDIFPNQDYCITSQLYRGARSFMLDVYYSDPVELCHVTCTEKFYDRLVDFKNNLLSDAEAVITLHLEDYTTREALQNEFDRVPELYQFFFNPQVWKNYTNWPTLQEMLSANQRFLIFSQKNENSGAYKNGAYIFFDQDITVENYWSMGATIGEHDKSCYSRWSNISLNALTATHPDFNGWTRLFVMNHFHGVPEYFHSGDDNEVGGSIGLKERVDYYCYPAAGRLPNYLAVDFVEQGDVFEYVEYLNNGGLIAYEGNGATQDIVCVFATTFDRTINLQDSDEDRLGCENDEMRSIVLENVRKGTRLTFFDSPDGSRKDDFMIVDILEDSSYISIGTFQQSFVGSNYVTRYSGGNGLDGKVSRIHVETSPQKFSESGIVLLEGNGGSQDLVCYFDLHSTFSTTMNGAGCSNDEARSAILIAGRQGSTITIYDSPSYSTGDDYTKIYVKKDFDHSIVIGTFEADFTNDYVTVTFYHHNGLDGKVSSIKVVAADERIRTFLLEGSTS